MCYVKIASSILYRLMMLPKTNQKKNLVDCDEWVATFYFFFLAKSRPVSFPLTPPLTHVAYICLNFFFFESNLVSSA